MFIELSDGTLINTERVMYTYKDTYPFNPMKMYSVVLDGPYTAECTQEDHDKIKAALLDGDQDIFREKVCHVLHEEMKGEQ